MQLLKTTTTNPDTAMKHILPLTFIALLLVPLAAPNAADTTPRNAAPESVEEMSRKFLQEAHRTLILPMP